MRLGAGAGIMKMGKLDGRLWIFCPVFVVLMTRTGFDPTLVLARNWFRSDTGFDTTLVNKSVKKGGQQIIVICRTASTASA